MAARYREGFEMQDRLPVINSSGTIAINTGTYRSGAASLGMNGSAMAEFNVLDSATQEAYFRICLRMNVKTTVAVRDALNHRCFELVFDTGTMNLQLRDSGGTVRATSVQNWALVTWYVVEMWARTTGTPSIVVRVDGDAWCTWSGALTYTDLRYLRVSTDAAGGTPVFVDDIGVNDTTGGVEDSWLGDRHIIIAVVDGDGDNTDLSNSGGGNNWQDVDEIPHDGDTTYVYESTDALYDLYTVNDVSATIGADDIFLVWVEATARQENAGADGVYLGVKSNASEDWSALRALTTSYTRVKGDFLDEDPGTAAAWDVLDIPSLQVGVTLES